MDTQTLMAVVGIIATVTLGIWAIAITIRYNRSVRITYAHDQAIALTNDITQNFPNLSITYREQAVSENLVLLKGYFINNGKKDISREMVEQQITLSLPDDYEWVECKVVESSPSLKASAIKVDRTHVSFDTGLWKSKEYMKFEALAKVPVVMADPDHLPHERPADRLRKSVSFIHRIADSGKIDETHVPRPLTKRSQRFSLLSLSPTRSIIMLSITMLIVGIGLLVLPRFWSTKNLGYILIADGKQRSVLADVKNNKIILTDDTGYRKEYSTAEFDALSDKKVQIVPKKDKSMQITGIAYVILSLFMLVVLSVKGMREQRLLSIITKNRT
jgi:hypothetical protein